MFNLLKSRTGVFCDGMTRRELLQIGGIGFAGINLPSLLRADASASRSRAESCILIFLNGGPSHLDMWDMKPNAPSEIRGEFKPISTTVPGIQYCEHLPRLARQAHHFALVRSAHHSVNNAHAAAVYTAMTGEDRGDATIAIGASPKDLPSIGSVMTRVRSMHKPVPPYVSLPYITKEGAGGPPQPGVYGGLIGRQYDPFFVLEDPNTPSFAVPNVTLSSDVTLERLSTRQGLLREVNQKMSGFEQHLSFRAMDGFQQQAFSMLMSQETRQAFDLSRESDKDRERYGRNIYGQSGLLARRLIEAGTRIVTLSWAPDANATWDTHGGNFEKLKNTLLPQLDGCLSSLIEDLDRRGMLDKTLVVCMGEFGRTPKINAGAGRDHWNYCYSLVMAGGGIKGQAVLGASDEQGGFPADNPVGPQDIIATIYELLGISHETELQDHLARPFRIVPNGRILHELTA